MDTVHRPLPRSPLDTGYHRPHSQAKCKGTLMILQFAYVLTCLPEHHQLWEVKLVFWSIWFSVVWGGILAPNNIVARLLTIWTLLVTGWWACLAIARILPAVVKSTIGVVLVSARRYIEWFQVLNRYVEPFTDATLMCVMYLKID
jgi:MFS family permease